MMSRWSSSSPGQRQSLNLSCPKRRPRTEVPPLEGWPSLLDRDRWSWRCGTETWRLWVYCLSLKGHSPSWRWRKDTFLKWQSIILNVFICPQSSGDFLVFALQGYSIVKQFIHLKITSSNTRVAFNICSYTELLRFEVWYSTQSYSREWRPDGHIQAGVCVERIRAGEGKTLRNSKEAVVYRVQK